ncbi:MAG TPA: hypothetical protein PLD87_11705 [Bacteroidia bacterium]|nr:hypothetical protein [Bacteroidia bacterium]
MKKITLLLLLTLSVLGLQAQTYQLNYDSIRVGKTAGTGGTSLYGKVYLKNVGLGLLSDSILTVLNGRIRKIPTISQFWQRSGTTLSPTTSGDNVAITVSNANGLIVTNNSATEAAISSRNNGSGNIHQFLNTTGAISAINNNGLLQTASGLSTEFLKANGTVDGSTYLTTTGSGAGLSGVVKLAGSQTITGVKTVDLSNGFKTDFYGNTIQVSNSGITQYTVLNNEGINYGNSTYELSVKVPTLTGNRSIQFPNASGTVALTSDIPTYTNFWQRSLTTLSPVTSNDKIFVSSNSGSSIESLNTGVGGLAVYGNSTNGIGGQFQSGSSVDAGLIAKNSSTGPIQHWLNNLAQVATISNSGSISSTPQGTLYGTASGSITSAQLATSLTDETGTGSAVFGTSPTLVTPVLGNATGGTLSLSGKLTSTLGNNTEIFNSASATTGYQFGRMTNTSGGLLWGIEGSAAGTLLTGGSAYGGFLTTGTSTNLELGTNQVKAITIDGTTQDVTIANNITADNLLSGTYTPTLTNGTNVSSSTAYTCQYMRVGNVVTVSGRIDVTMTASNTATEISVSLPIVSNFSGTENLGGTGNGVGSNSPNGVKIEADTTNDRATYTFDTGGSGGARKISFSFTYLIL